MKKIFLLILLGGLLFPLVGLADGTYIATEDSTAYTIYYEGLVPCGKKVCKFNPSGSGVCDGETLYGAEYLECKIRTGESLESACVLPVGIEMIGETLAGTDIEVGFPCTFCHLFVMIDGIIDFVLFKLVPPIAILMLVIGGVMYMMAHFGGAEMLPGGVKGGPAMLGRAKKLMTSVVIGLIIIFAAWLIIDLFFSLIGVAEWTGLEKGWFTIKCPIALP